MIKNIGIILIAIGLAFAIFSLYLYTKQRGSTVSPIPENSGVKVIYEK